MSAKSPLLVKAQRPDFKKKATGIAIALRDTCREGNNQNEIFKNVFRSLAVDRAVWCKDFSGERREPNADCKRRRRHGKGD